MPSPEGTSGRAGRYARIYAQLADLIVGRSPGIIAAMATMCAVLHAKLPHHSWTGFHLVEGDELHVGLYQGPVACQVLRGGGRLHHLPQDGAADPFPRDVLPE